MKVALCFLISGKQIVNKEQIWIKWLNDFENKDLFNIYFHYKDYNTISSPWIKQHAIPHNYIAQTSYYYVVPAYMNLLAYGLKHDKENQWFIFLTESCVPILSPTQFEALFLSYHNYSILNWRKPWWNIDLVKRANLNKLKKNLQFGHDPYFVLKREDVLSLIKGLSLSPALFNIYKIVCRGAVANESVFAILFYLLGLLESKNMINAATHATDWSRQSSPTSPHIFSAISNKNADQQFISQFLQINKYTLFLRKVAPDFSDDIIYDKIKNQK